MAIRDVFKVTRKTFFNPRAWFGYDEFKYQTIWLWAMLKSTFKVQAPMREESFEDAMKRLQLTENDIRASVSNYKMFAILFLILATAAFAYAFYLLFQHGTFLGWMLGIGVSALFASQAFRFDFWSYQMRERRLGATYQEWKRDILGDKGGKND